MQSGSPRGLELYWNGDRGSNLSVDGVFELLRNLWCRHLCSTLRERVDATFDSLLKDSAVRADIWKRKNIRRRIEVRGGG